MDEPLGGISRFFRELKRRNVYKVAATYAVVVFVTLEAAQLVFPATTLEGVYDVLVVLAFVGFPIAVVVAWAFELTPEGVRRTPAAETPAEGPEPAAERRPRSRLAMKALVGLGIVAAAVAGGWYLTGGGGSTISDRSVAVLPFETLGDPASTPFTEGLHNDLLTDLQRVSDLTVIARPSVMRYEDTDKPLSQVAEELNARWIVTAAVQEAGGRVRVNPRLVDPRTGTERWSDSYQGELSADRVFALQQEITRSIAEALEAELATGERERLEQRPTEDLEAYRLYVQGRRHFGRRSHPYEPDEHVEEAVRYFRRAIERDSSFALAWAGLADAAATYPSPVPDSSVAPEVSQESAARRALELDPDLAEAHASMGFVHLRGQNAPGALRELKRALDLKPSYWEAHAWLGELYLKIGHGQKALDHLTLAVELNPRHPIARWRLYDAYLATGQPEKSLQEARRQRRSGATSGVTTGVGGELRALYHLGRFEEVRRLASENEMHHYLVLVAAAEGDTARARKHFEQARPDLPPIWWGLLHNALGETERAFEIYGRMDDEDWGFIWTVGHLRYGILLDLSRLRGDPRYEAWIREANRAWGLNPDGSLPDSVDVSFDAPAGG